MSNKATEESLGELHGVVARILKKQLEAEERITTESGDEIVISTVSPAMVAQAIKFLKDNNITSDIEQDENLQSLEETLKHKRKRGHIKLVDPKLAAGDNNE